MVEAVRISPEEAREKITSGKALLVCGYDDAHKFRDNYLEGAISLPELKAKLSSLSKDQEIIFYCA